MAASSRVTDEVLDPSQEDVLARVPEITGGTGADVAFECAGVNAVLDTMLDAVRPGGVTIVLDGLWSRASTPSSTTRTPP